jgi:hypothetical protein
MIDINDIIVGGKDGDLLYVLDRITGVTILKMEYSISDNFEGIKATVN